MLALLIVAATVWQNFVSGEDAMNSRMVAYVGNWEVRLLVSSHYFFVEQMNMTHKMLL